MRRKDALDFFGTISQAAKALGVSRQAVHQWPPVIPIITAMKIEQMTGGKLKVNKKLYVGSGK